jgi:hypothetical protein
MGKASLDSWYAKKLQQFGESGGLEVMVQYGDFWDVCVTTLSILVCYIMMLVCVEGPKGPMLDKSA